jgi:hypothetical protein
MPIPKRKKNEDKNTFVSRCMSNETMKKEYPDQQQRIAICIGQTKSSLLEQVCDIIDYDPDVELLNDNNIYIPDHSEYLDAGEDEEEYIFPVVSKYAYMDPVTQEYFYYQSPGIKKKNNRNLIFVSEASEYQGRKVKLNKPFRTPGGPKKFSVYVKNEKGNVVKVNFGDPNMKIKKNIPGRRKSFRARHNCDNPGPKWKARYWSCKAW